MKSLTESPALLTVHTGSPGQYIVRVGDLSNRSLVAGVIKLLTDGESFVVVTPTDTKVFTSVNGTSAPLESEPESPVPLDPETLAAIAAEEGRAMPNADVEEGDGLEEVTPPPSKARRRPKPVSVAGHDEPCGRCRGAGRVSMAMPDGSAAEAACPICRGEGVMKRYGARR